MAAAVEALKITGPLIHGKYVVKVRDGEVWAKLARKPHRERYRDSGSVAVPTSIMRPVRIVGEGEPEYPPELVN